MSAQGAGTALSTWYALPCARNGQNKINKVPPYHHTDNFQYITTVEVQNNKSCRTDSHSARRSQIIRYGGWDFRLDKWGGDSILNLSDMGVALNHPNFRWGFSTKSTIHRRDAQRPSRIAASEAEPSHGKDRPRWTTALGGHVWFVPGARSSTAIDMLMG